MKRIALSLFTALALTPPCFGVVLYESDFSTDSLGGWRRQTTGTQSRAYSDTWSITTSRVEYSNDPALQVSIATTLALPAAHNIYGGYYPRISELAILPADWEFAFNLYVTVVEPYQVLVVVNEPAPATSPIFFPHYSQTTYTFWVQPQNLGWNDFKATSDDSYSLTQGFGSSFPGTNLGILMASHDGNGNPLSLATVGVHTFAVDDLVFTSIPEPSAVWLSCLALVAGSAKSRLRGFRR